MVNELTGQAHETNLIAEEHYRRYLSNLLSGNHRECTSIVRRLLDDSVDIQSLYVDLFQRSLYEVGELWERNEISVAVEHLATSITENMLAVVFPSISAPDPSGKTVVVSCGANELHQIGGRIVADTFELHGWNSHFLGANTPCEDLLAMVDQKKPDMVALSICVYYNWSPFLRTLEAVCGSFPDLPVLAGGQAFNWGDQDISSRFKQVSVVRSINELTRALRQE